VTAVDRVRLGRLEEQAPAVRRQVVVNQVVMVVVAVG
jgi:hypothetical protein